MLSAREYVEIMTTKRLVKKKGNEAEYKRLHKRLENLIYKMSRINTIPGFTPEDIEGFFCLKIWAESNKSYDNEFSYFAKSFENLMRDLIRDINRAEKRLPKDPIDACVFWSDMDR
jgi:hypothetical protein